MPSKPELERALEDRCVARIEAAGGLALKLQIPGVRGFPDRTCLFPGGMVFFMEFKRPKGGVISKQQHKWRILLFGLGFNTYFIADDQEFTKTMFQESVAPLPYGRVM